MSPIRILQQPQCPWDANTSVSANFAPVIVYCDLTTSGTAGGSVTVPGEGTFTYECGTVVELTATAGEGFEFVNWTGGVANPDSATTTVTVDANTSVSANFAPVIVYCDLTTSGTAGGSVTVPGEGTFTYECGTVVELTATAGEGFEFVNWTGNVANPESATTTVTVDANTSVFANFAPVIINYGLTLSSSEGGSITTPGEGIFTYSQGSDIELVSAPGEGFVFVNWTGDVANPNEAATSVIIDGNKSVMANFTPVATPTLVAHYEFENDYSDTSGNENHGEKRWFCLFKRENQTGR
jgi:uncharacterized repeat protein (TIGR02543 family)